MADVIHYLLYVKTIRRLILNLCHTLSSLPGDGIALSLGWSNRGQPAAPLCDFDTSPAPPRLRRRAAGAPGQSSLARDRERLPYRLLGRGRMLW